MSTTHLELKPEQEAAVGYVLSCPTYEEAAAKANVSPATLRRWLAKPAFRAAVLRASKEVVAGVVRRLQGLALKATDTLETLLASTNPSVALGAAKLVLTHTLDSFPVDLKRELAAALRKAEDEDFDRVLRRARGEDVGDGDEPGDDGEGF
jgi:hypothetical protein